MWPFAFDLDAGILPLKGRPPFRRLVHVVVPTVVDILDIVGEHIMN